MSGQALLLLSEHASYMTGGEYFVDGSVYFLSLSVMNSLKLIIFILAGIWFGKRDKDQRSKL